MRTCSSCGGAWRCQPPDDSSADPAWTCGQCSHISDLEKSLENARKERDEALASATRGWEVADSFHVQKAAESLKHSGQVAEDVVCLRATIREWTTYSAGSREDDLAALSRLAAKAQGYEAFAAACREALGPHRSTGTPADVSLLHKDLEASRAFSVQFGNERDATVADNAALVKRAKDIAEDESNILEWRNAAHAILGNDPHPGTALLGRMKRLEAACRAVYSFPGKGQATGTDYNRAESVLVAVARGDPLPCLDAACAKCRSGEPCH